jgi:hypothetical protein
MRWDSVEMVIVDVLSIILEIFALFTDVLHSHYVTLL